MVLAMKAGLDPAKVLKLVSEGAGSSRVLQLRGPMMVKGNYRKATMTLATWQKDMAIIAEFARAPASKRRCFRRPAPIYADAVKTRSQEDTAAVCAVLEKWHTIAEDDRSSCGSSRLHRPRGLSSPRRAGHRRARPTVSRICRASGLTPASRRSNGRVRSAIRKTLTDAESLS